VKISGSDPEFETAVADARATYRQLRVFNRGGIARNREPLESSLDRSVILLSKFMVKTHGENLQIVSQAFRDIRDYRRLFPRTAASNQDQAEEAQRILDAITGV
jgi:hypothetical protein